MHHRYALIYVKHKGGNILPAPVQTNSSDVDDFVKFIAYFRYLHPLCAATFLFPGPSDRAVSS